MVYLSERHQSATGEFLPEVERSVGGGYTGYTTSLPDYSIPTDSHSLRTQCGSSVTAASIASLSSEGLLRGWPASPAWRERQPASPAKEQPRQRLTPRQKYGLGSRLARPRSKGPPVLLPRPPKLQPQQLYQLVLEHGPEAAWHEHSKRLTEQAADLDEHTVGNGGQGGRQLAASSILNQTAERVRRLLDAASNTQGGNTQSTTAGKQEWPIAAEGAATAAAAAPRRPLFNGAPPLPPPATPPQPSTSQRPPVPTPTLTPTPTQPPSPRHRTRPSAASLQLPQNVLCSPDLQCRVIPKLHALYTWRPRLFEQLLPKYLLVLDSDCTLHLYRTLVRIQPPLPPPPQFRLPSNLSSMAGSVDPLSQLSGTTRSISSLNQLQEQGQEQRLQQQQERQQQQQGRQQRQQGRQEQQQEWQEQRQQRQQERQEQRQASLLGEAFSLEALQGSAVRDRQDFELMLQAVHAATTPKLSRMGPEALAAIPACMAACGAGQRRFYLDGGVGRSGRGGLGRSGGRGDGRSSSSRGVGSSGRSASSSRGGGSSGRSASSRPGRVSGISRGRADQAGMLAAAPHEHAGGAPSRAGDEHAGGAPSRAGDKHAGEALSQASDEPAGEASSEAGSTQEAGVQGTTPSGHVQQARARPRRHMPLQQQPNWTPAEGSLMEAWFEATLPRLSQLSPSQLAQVALGLGALGAVPPPAWTRRYVRVAARKVPSFQPLQLTDLLRGLALMSSHWPRIALSPSSRHTVAGGSAAAGGARAADWGTLGGRAGNLTGAGAAASTAAVTAATAPSIPTPAAVTEGMPEASLVTLRVQLSTQLLDAVQAVLSPNPVPPGSDHLASAALVWAAATFETPPAVWTRWFMYHIRAVLRLSQGPRGLGPPRASQAKSQLRVQPADESQPSLQGQQGQGSSSSSAALDGGKGRLGQVGRQGEGGKSSGKGARDEAGPGVEVKGASVARPAVGQGTQSPRQGQGHKQGKREGRGQEQGQGQAKRQPQGHEDGQDYGEAEVKEAPYRLQAEDVLLLWEAAAQLLQRCPHVEHEHKIAGPKLVAQAAAAVASIEGGRQGAAELQLVAQAGVARAEAPTAKAERQALAGDARYGGGNAEKSAASAVVESALAGAARESAAEGAKESAAAEGAKESSAAEGAKESTAKGAKESSAAKGVEESAAEGAEESSAADNVEESAAEGAEESSAADNVEESAAAVGLEAARVNLALRDLARMLMSEVGHSLRRNKLGGQHAARACAAALAITAAAPGSDVVGCADTPTPTLGASTSAATLASTPTPMPTPAPTPTLGASTCAATMASSTADVVQRPQESNLVTFRHPNHQLVQQPQQQRWIQGVEPKVVIQTKFKPPRPTLRAAELRELSAAAAMRSLADMPKLSAQEVAAVAALLATAPCRSPEPRTWAAAALVHTRQAPLLVAASSACVAALLHLLPGLLGGALPVTWVQAVLWEVLRRLQASLESLRPVLPSEASASKHQAQRKEETRLDGSSHVSTSSSDETGTLPRPGRPARGSTASSPCPADTRCIEEDLGLLAQVLRLPAAQGAVQAVAAQQPVLLQALRVTCERLEAVDPGLEDAAEASELLRPLQAGGTGG